MPRIPEAVIEQLKKNIPLTRLCQERGIELKKAGRKELVGKCPFHPDKKASFSVSLEKNLYHCLGCDAKGSNIDFVMKADKLDFRQAVEKLLAVSPVPPTEAKPEAEKPRPVVSPERTAVLLEKVVASYERRFSGATEGRNYLEGRGISDAGLFRRFRLGYCNGKLTDILPKNGAVPDELKAIGVMLANGEERFLGNVVFPVYDAEGQLTTLYGRRIGQEGERRHYFLPDRPTGIWNAVALKTYSEIILVESVIDALSVMVAGSPNVVAIQGTNGFNDSDIELLKRHGVQKVTLLLDGDEAGRKAAERLKEKLSSFSCLILSLPDSHDPNSYLMKHGARGLAGFIRGVDVQSSAVPPSDASVLTCGLRRYEVRGLEKGERKLKLTLRAECNGKLHIDTLDLFHARSRKTLAFDLCRIFGETAETVEGDIEKLIRHCEAMEEQKLDMGAVKLDPERTMTAAERKEAEDFGRSPDLIERILADFERCGLVGEESNKLLGYIAMTSRKRDIPLSVLILSSSGAGKTALQDAVCAYCPPEDLVKLTSLSGKALFYKERLSLKHKLLALEEGDGAEDASYAIRNLISARELVTESTIKDLATGRLTTMENRVEGSTSVFLTTTNPEVDAETKSRFFVTSIDESREQTRKILSFQRQAHLSDGLIASAEIEAVLAKHRNFQRLLKPVAVKNPFAAQLTYGDDRLQGRRDQPKYLNLIKAVAFLRQMTKEIHHEQKNGAAVPFIVVDKDDMKLANKLAHEILGHSLDELSRPSRDLLMQLEEMVKRRKAEAENPKTENKEEPWPLFSFSRRQIREHTGWTNTRLHIHLKELTDFEHIVAEAGRNGMPYRYRLAYDGQGKDGRRFMLGLMDADGLKESK